MVFYALTVLLLAVSQTVHAAAAWDAEWERTVKAAEQEGEVSYYAVGEIGFVSEFEKKFPRIKVKVVQGRGNDLLVRTMTERRAGKFLADVARIGNTSPYALYQAKVLQALPGAFILPEVKDESKWWSGKHQYIDAEGKYIFVSVGTVSVNMMAYNTELVAPSEVASFWDLLNEKWRAKIVVIDPRSVGYGRSSARTVYYHPQLGPEYLRRLFSEQVVMVSRDYRQAIDWIAQRRFSILLFGNGDDILQAKAQGLPINVFDTGGWKEGGVLEPGAFTPGLARPIASSERGESFHKLVALARRANGGSARRRRSKRLAQDRYSENRIAAHGQTQGRREVHGHVEGGMDGRRAHAESGQSSAGEKREQALMN